SLSRRIACVMILAIVAVHFQAFLQIRLLSTPELRITGVRHLSEATGRAVQDAMRIQPEQRRSYFANRTVDQHLRIWWSQEPIVKAEEIDSGPLAGKLIATLTQVLGETVQDIRVSNGKFTYRLPMRSAQIVVVPEELIGSVKQEAVSQHQPEVLLVAGAKIATQLGDGSWVNVQHSSFVDTAFGSTLPYFPLIAGGLMIALISGLWARCLVSPLNRLVDAANRVVSIREPVSVEKSGLHEFAAVAEAFEDMQQRLLGFVDARTQMLAAISHDLRSALTRLQLIAERSDNENQRRALTAEIQEMTAMLESTMMFASGEAKLAPDQPTDVAALLISIADETADAGGDCRYNGPNHLETLANPISLKRAFRNVISNAIKYGGQARVVLKVEASELLIEISDSGPGIAIENQGRAFAPFERLDAARSNTVKGGGLGLTIARDVIQSHGGEIWLENRACGGLKVSMRLPRIETR
ncbi:MAG: HAMP domain-containing sensor histidine kinase, partial [Pseudomonadota bacterium]